MTGIPAGMIGLTKIAGDVGKAIEFGQLINGEGFERWEHAFVTLPGGLILEAEPGGARIVPFSYTDVYWCKAIYAASPLVGSASPVLLSQTAQSLKGTPYSFLDYAALSAHRLHVWAPGLKGFIESDGHMICSQLADEFYLRLGAHVFTDDRWPGFVTPASLYWRDQHLIRW